MDPEPRGGARASGRDPGRGLRAQGRQPARPAGRARLAPLVAAAVALFARAPLAAQGERPQYEATLALLDEASTGSAEAQRELQRRAVELEAAAFGLDPLDADTVLASAFTLSYLGRTRADELSELAGLLGDLLARSPEQPELALALVQTRSALLEVRPASPEELRIALDHAPTVRAADGRDRLGCRLAGALYTLRTAVDPERALVELQLELETFSSDGLARPYLAAWVSDGWRVRNDFSGAWRWIQEAERGLEPRRDDPHLARTVAGTRCQLELACGLVELAAASLEREREAVERGATDAESKLGLLLDTAGVALASLQPARIRAAAAVLEEALSDEELFARRPGDRAQVLARRAALADLLEDLEPSGTRAPEDWLAAALADEHLDPLHRLFLELKSVGLAHRRGDFEGAAKRLAEIGREPTASKELADTRSAWRALLALARQASEAELLTSSRELDGHFDDFVASWSSAPERPGGLGYLFATNRLLLLGAELELCLRLEGEDAAARAVERWLPVQALGSLARALDARAGSLTRVRERLLGPETGLLLYLPGYRVVHLFCIDRETIEHVPLAWNVDRERAPLELDELLSSSPARWTEGESALQRKRIDELARTLSERLLPPAALARIKSWKAVYVVGADLLGGVPFALLPLGKGGPPLGLERGVVDLPSLPVGLALEARTRPETPRQLLLVTGPGVLPQSEQAQALRAAFTAGFERCEVLVPSEATVARIRAEQEHSRAALLHIVAHGASDLTREACGGLRLSGPGAGETLWCEQVLEKALLPSPLVVLSSCSAARGPRRTGDDGLAQLGGALLASGARCALLPAADVALEPTLLLMQSFQRELLRGATQAEALRVARRELVSDPRFDDPFYWASWRLVGLGMELLFPR